MLLSLLWKYIYRKKFWLVHREFSFDQILFQFSFSCLEYISEVRQSKSIVQW